MLKLWTWNVNVDEVLNALRRKVNHLEALESDNSILVENGERQPGKKRKREVECWFTNVQDKKTALKQIETECKEKGPSDSLKNYIEKQIKEVEELIQHGKFPNGVVLDDHASTRLPLVTTKLVGQGCSKNIASMLGWLKEDNVFAIGIHGMGGVGKTTLMKHIHNKLLEDSDTRRNVFWVTTSQECSLPKLQTDIGKALGLDDLSQFDNESRKALLFRGFSQLGKFVLFLDDLWKHYPIEDIGIPCSLCGCKMIFSTRSWDVCNRMICHKTIKIAPLCGSDAMKLFVDTLGAALPIELNLIAEKIVAECGGLPLALKTMGCCMRGMDDVHEWKNSLCELRTPIIRQDSMEDEVFRVLKFSYNNLKDKTIQNCFLSCVLFPEDYEISRDLLVSLWINEGLLDEVKSEKDKVIRGQAILNRLEKSCLLESVTHCYLGKKCVKMHDLIRDMAIIITQSSPHFMANSGTNLEKVPEKEQWSEDLLKVSMSRNSISEIPSDFAPLTMKLSVLFLNNNPLKEIPEPFFVHMTSLRILDLSMTKINRLPFSLSKMENLRALLLGHCRKLTYVPSLARLTNLRVLDLSCTGIKRVPDSFSELETLRELLLGSCKELTFIPSLARLTNLRVLDLKGDKQLGRAPKGLEGLKKLEEIPYCPWNVNDIGGFSRLMKSCPSLSIYRFWLKPLETKTDYELGFIREWFKSYERAVWIIGAEVDEDETILISNTIELLRIEKSEMKGRRLLGDIFPSLSETKNLNQIFIQQCRGLEYIISSSPLSGPQPGTRMCAPLDTIVTSLSLQGLPDLKRIVELGCCLFSKLVKLDIINCPKIKEVFSFPLLNHKPILPHLYYLEVSKCEEVEEIFKSNNAPPPNPILVLPKLGCLVLFNLPKLGSIYKGLLLVTSYVTIRNCPKLKVLQGEKVICDASSPTLASIKSEHTKEWWEWLYQYYPRAASTLTCLIDNLHPSSVQEEDDEKSK